MLNALSVSTLVLCLCYAHAHTRTHLHTTAQLYGTLVQAKLSAKAPFNEYSNVRGLKVHWGSPMDYSTYPEGPFDVVYDNNGKDMDSCKPLIDAAKVGGRVARIS